MLNESCFRNILDVPRVHLYIEYCREQSLAVEVKVSDRYLQY